jgi:hypothetical protein
MLWGLPEAPSQYTLELVMGAMYRPGDAASTGEGSIQAKGGSSS